MPTQEQIEAVAREIDPASWHPAYDDFDARSWHQTRRRESIAKAKDAIAAYEATRPAVSDEELVDVLQRARSLHHFGEADGFAPRDPDWMKGMIAGIRAVRERLEP